MHKLKMVNSLRFIVFVFWIMYYEIYKEKRWNENDNINNKAYRIPVQPAGSYKKATRKEGSIVLESPLIKGLP